MTKFSQNTFKYDRRETQVRINNEILVEEGS